ncbi:MAG TPA: response regulator [Polyangiaceae bacterium]
MNRRTHEYALLVEDDPGVREGLAEIMRSEGYPVVTCPDAKIAMDLLISGADLPCVIFLDFMMPNMDGWSFLDERKKRSWLRDIPVVGMSASQKLVERSEPPAGVDDLLKKPFKVESILRAIEKYFPGRSIEAPRNLGAGG